MNLISPFNSAQPARRNRSTLGNMDVFPGEERRSPHRLPDPVCPQCQAAMVRVTVRTELAVGYRCRACDETWIVQKPESSAAAASITLIRL
jgi:ssDNA-binding Zn-finger/Zn-ribbon topoisomerase 1